eukprot:TRINITY_DN7768_c0_g1_i5.p1 TRINITY_DN7768_c0_g1~~TRINITY_DN7768_c0_g1_i5.p1  ORF type:complete len:446 (+),score=41.90 TRINITY_DN7768_c0_g1_i5:21-1358(+)
MERKRPLVTSADGFGFAQDVAEMEHFLSCFDQACVEDFERQLRLEASYDCTTTYAFSDLIPFANNGFNSIVRDSFTQCFQGRGKFRWNTTWYLSMLYYVGVFIRYCILFPLRLAVLMASMLLFVNIFLFAMIMPKRIHRSLGASGIRIVNSAFVFAFCAVITVKGQIPARQPGQIYVANHTSVIDIVVLLSQQLYGLTGQGHGGVIGFFQKVVLNFGTDNLWFDRMASRDRSLVAQQIREHAQDTSKHPLLVFPEGTCVNNEFVVMFKRGAFDLGKVIVPVAIKYNLDITDAFWNSKKTSFPGHVFHLMTSWALVVTVSYLEPQTKRPGESSAQFAARVKEMIACEAGLQSVPWDGYFKYFQPKPEYKKRRQQVFTRQLIRRFQLESVVEEFEQLGKSRTLETSATSDLATTETSMTPSQLQTQRIEQLQAVSRRKALSENAVVA